ncbi:type II secretion system F family protein [Candidatus Pacearchaeota archaeon]|nr:type II secretion system F family protein [Candidatus Pacearchaeota archaeon]
MLNKKEDFFLDFKRDISKEVRMVKEINVFSKEMGKKSNSGDKKEIEEQIKTLKKEMKKVGDGIVKKLNQLSLNASLKSRIMQIIPERKAEGKSRKKNFLSVPEFLKFQNKYKISKIEKETLKRLKQKEEEEKVERKKIKKPSRYIGFANKLFSEFSAEMIKKYGFRELQVDIVKANMNFLLRSYLSVIILTTLISLFAAVLIVVFLLFFNIGTILPFVTLRTESIALRFLKTFWLIFIFPTTTLLFMYFYPSLERDSVGKKIEQELPFATINMAAISGSLIDPTKMFNIIISTKEYPYLEKEFNKLLNTVNVLGQDFVSALRNSSFNTASKKLADLFNGLSTTISSGGDLVKFFGERAETMLFEYNLEREKSTKAAETFMDIYISVVIAAPMILMLLLMMMRISGLGISLSTSAITLIMILGVIGINIAFLVFLQLKQPNV